MRDLLILDPKLSQLTAEKMLRANLSELHILVTYWHSKSSEVSSANVCVRDETINHIISECSKLAQKEYKTRHDSVGKVIHWEMCKKFKFDQTNK